MANKFTKSVLERQEKEYRSAAKTKSATPAALETPKAPASPEISGPTTEPKAESPTAQHTAENAPPSANIPENDSAITESPIKTPSQPPEPDPIPPEAPAPTAQSALSRQMPAKKGQIPAFQNEGLCLDDFIIRDEGRNAKNKTFYLDTAVIQAIKKAATAQKVTESKLVNDILKKILGIS